MKAQDATLFTDNFKAKPYWWDASPLAADSGTDLPTSVDVAIIGSGFTGLSAALQTSRAGRDTLVLDADQAGYGCSTRNGGQISSSIKPGFAELVKHYSPDIATRILTEGHRALDWIGEFTQSEKIDCDFRRCGRFYGAHTPQVFTTLADKLKDQPPGVTLDAELVSRDEQKDYIDSDSYHGGIFYRNHACLDPGKYHHGLMTRAREAGASIISHARVTQLKKQGDGFQLSTAKGVVKANEVIVATNGYSTGIVPWLRKRVIPIGSYMIATEVLPQEQVERLIPQARVVTDSRKLVVYYRPSPDRRRLLFGARVSITETDPVTSASALRDEVASRFPELAQVRVSHAWMGFVAYTFDAMPHVGCHDGIHYAMGYCGSGVSLSSYCGTRVAQQLLGHAEGKTAFSETKFNGRFYYRRKPWFLAPSIRYYRWQDQRDHAAS